MPVSIRLAKTDRSLRRSRAWSKLATSWLLPALTVWVLVGCSSLPSAPQTRTPAPPVPGPPISPTETALIRPSSTPSALPSETPSLTPVPIEVDLGLSAISYRIPLTIRHVTGGMVVLNFELSEPAAGTVYVRPIGSGDPRQEVDFSAPETRHQIIFEELLPGSRYRATVALEVGGQELQQPNFLGRAWGPVSFVVPQPEDPLRFGVVGDASFGDPATRALIEQMAGADLDFVLHAGDVVDETELGVNPYDSYSRKFYDTFEPLLRQLPVYTVPGNHDYDLDIRLEDVPFYFRAFPAFPDPEQPGQGTAERNQFYAFESRDIQFVMLDSQVLFGVPGREEEQSWLEERLADTRFKTTIPVMHVAPFSSSSVHPTDSLPVRQAWVPLFETAHVPLVFSGHFHQYERLTVNGITYIVSGGGSSTLYAPGPMLPQSQAFRRQTHFVLCEVNEDTLVLTAVGLGGEVIDGAVLQLK